MPKKTGGDLGLTSVIPTLALVSATKLVRDNKNLFKGGECTDTNYQPGGNMYLTRKHIKPKGKRTVKGGNAMDINSLREQIGLYLNGGNRNLMMYGYENGNTDTIEGGKKVTPKKPRKAMKGGNESLNSEVQEIEEQNTMDDKSAMDNKGLEMQGGKKTKTKSKRGRKVMKGGNESEANHEALDSKALDSELIGTIKGGKNNTLDRLRSQIAGFLQKMNDKK